MATVQSHFWEILFTGQKGLSKLNKQLQQQQRNKQQQQKHKRTKAPN